jgi:hypothetical protein
MNGLMDACVHWIVLEWKVWDGVLGIGLLLPLLLLINSLVYKISPQK